VNTPRRVVHTLDTFVRICFISFLFLTKGTFGSELVVATSNLDGIVDLFFSTIAIELNAQPHKLW